MSQPTGTIVVGIDGSSSSEDALAWAIEQALLEHRPLTLLHGMGDPTSPWVDHAVLDKPGSAYAALRAEGARVLESARAHVAQQAPQIELHEILEFVDPRELLLEQSRGASLLVLGSRGRGPIQSTLLGSVGVAVARHTACPTVIHRGNHRGPTGNGVLVAADAAPESLPVLEFAYHQAELTGLPLTVMHCYWDMQAYSGYYPAGILPIDSEQVRLAVAETIAGLADKYPDVSVTETLVGGLPEVQVATAGDDMDLVVVGAHQGSRLKQLMFDSVSVQVVEHATRPVAVVPVTSVD
jgi:nucleotide-binding universal stress UspA family protein